MNNAIMNKRRVESRLKYYKKQGYRLTEANMKMGLMEISDAEYTKLLKVYWPDEV